MPEAQRKHSGLGIASFVISLIAGPGMFIVIAAGGLMAASAPGGELDEKSGAAIGIGLAIFGGMFVALIGAGLGIAGAVAKDRRRVFAVLGLIFNAMLLLKYRGLDGGRSGDEMMLS
ncbi:MAG: hypothetical protein EXR72_06975 [Myxococcales bacterium]|nr:hypothetical protein [Myxococcales bacterium]